MTPSDANFVTRSSSSGVLIERSMYSRKKIAASPRTTPSGKALCRFFFIVTLNRPRRKMRVIDDVDVVRRRRAAQPRRDLGLVLPLLERIEQRLFRLQRVRLRSVKRAALALMTIVSRFCRSSAANIWSSVCCAATRSRCAASLARCERAR